MDPTIAALLGAGLGSAGSILAAVVAPLLTSRRERWARRREIKREVYAEALRSVIAYRSCRTAEDLENVRERINEASVQISLVGSRASHIAYGELMLWVGDLIEAVLNEAGRYVYDQAKINAEAGFPEDKRDLIMRSQSVFIEIARREIKALEPVRIRIWHWLRNR
jgi:hypothetical protein